MAYDAIMTDHDPGHFSHEGDPSRHPDIPRTEQFIDSDSNVWVATDSQSIRDNLLDKFAEHIATVTKRYQHLDMSNETQYRIFTDNLVELVEPESSQIDMLAGQWVVIRGLDHYIFNGVPRVIPQGTTVCGQYTEVAVSPHYQYDYEREKMFEMLPHGVALSVTDLRYISDGGTFVVVDEVPEHEHVLLTLHGQHVQLSRLDYVQVDRDDDDGISNDRVINEWHSYLEVDTSGGYSLN